METVATQSTEVVDNWNAVRPVGTPVLYKPFKNAPVSRTRTASAAWLLNGRPMISLRHVKGDVPLEHVTPRYVVWIRVKRPKQVSHWVEAPWDSKEQCDRAIEMMCETDKSVISIERSSIRPEDA